MLRSNCKAVPNAAFIVQNAAAHSTPPHWDSPAGEPLVETEASLLGAEASAAAGLSKAGREATDMARGVGAAEDALDSEPAGLGRRECCFIS